MDKTIPSAGLGAELTGQLQPVVDSLGQVYHRHLVSILLYGSAARGDFISGRSDVNLLVTLQSIRLEDLTEAAAPAAVGNRSREAVSFQQSASDTPFAMADLSGYAALTRPAAER